MKKIISPYILIILTLLTLVNGVNAQNKSDTSHKQKWKISLDAYRGVTWGDNFSILKPQVAYAYSSKKSISFGIIVLDEERGYDYYSHKKGIRNGISFGHTWSFYTNVKKNISGWMGIQLWYLQGDIAYKKLYSSDNPFTYYAPNAIYGLYDIGVCLKIGKRCTINPSFNPGIGYIYGTDIRKIMTILGLSLKIGYAF